MMRDLTLEDFKEGQLICFDKPLGWTSFQVVNKVRWLIKRKFGIKKIKVGHAGTLDPLATGLVILCTGKYTKQIESLMGQTKVYIGEITLGATRPSYDMETEIDQTFETKHITSDLLEEVRQEFLGEIMQQPPIFSALKKDGKKLYEYARKGEEVEIPKRQVLIDDFQLTKFDLPKFEFKVTCSKGTYIRSLAHDYGMAVKSGAYLSALKRTQIGDYKISNALSIEGFEDMMKA
ncbi:tRNA pseudouridine55 synthase [Psychroflexus halocasei]|uniref:tRNA pseudouridine synthase B n=2 Tax=Psychroflexus halocasei TaxID=908615 RepID=A0A1H4CMP7_9FLAO|nr:tRNA pseudouridine55 synthase [Psychroflexus halocasei]